MELTENCNANLVHSIILFIRQHSTFARKIDFLSCEAIVNKRKLQLVNGNNPEEMNRKTLADNKVIVFNRILCSVGNGVTNKTDFNQC